MEYTNGGYRYENIRSNAYWHNVQLDTRLKPADITDTLATEYHYRDCLKQPTVSLLARKKYESFNYPSFRTRNEAIINSYPEVKALKNSFEKKFNEELYPKTKNARKYLIDKEFVILDYIKPRVKTFGKMLFKLFGK